MNDDPSKISVLDDAHAGAFREALARILSTQVAEFTFSEILDGLPTVDSFLEFHVYTNQENPVFELNHTLLCPGVVQRTRAFRDAFDPLALTFPPGLLSAFQQSYPGTQRFELRLIELLAVSCHQIAVYLYSLDDGVHPHRVYEEWRDLPRERVHGPFQYIAPIPFYHGSYLAHTQYPNGLADVVGYWAEAKIFGGVVLFDRGESGTECRDLFLHPGRYKGPRTIYPPTPKQYDALIDFLLGQAPPTDGSNCPIPIHPTLENRWRFDPWDSMTRFNIFRDRYERKPPRGSKPRSCVRSEVRKGKPLNQAAMAAALQRLRQITPSSPLWADWGNVGSVVFYRLHKPEEVSRYSLEFGSSTVDK
ncbi:uncharacterized protein THITE_2083603 [Thermothielavioides terrestris NRRL 8126]|uniref:Uncharacterized protein n=1 Tax=Thermothielavioides terrestris (strain ATCC 38088 / NRRL 8126) TaxID=578455 RepID=G2RGJ0_THETT|nr:uncharacterized protein THITE_2083603 [Thermothielavioides terrestris NRRL 8126]AEO71879.1 hypothetical protein THITE_2083603 [Thermothielavioides terrestris NRRL 8126]